MEPMLKTLGALYKLLERLGDSLRWLPPFVARVGVGWLFMETGWGKLNNLTKVTEYFTELGLPAPGFQAALVATTELTCGTLILLGLATRLAVIPLTITMIVALATALRDQIDSLSALFGLAECLYIVIFMWLGTYGPGPLSLDWLIERRRGRRSNASVLGTPARVTT